MDIEMENMKDHMEATWGRFAFRRGSETEKKALELINRENFRAASGMGAPMLKPPPSY